MKRFRCLLAQRKSDPTGPLATHVSHCRECRDFFEKVSSLESRLVTDAGEPDRDLCAGILASISSENTAAFVPPKRTSSLSPMVLSTASIAVFSLIVVLTILNSSKPGQVVESPMNADAPIPQTPGGSQEKTLAYAWQQKELVQRDALKLGAHLRKNLILFQTDDQQ
jgi:hypothetical protein